MKKLEFKKYYERASGPSFNLHPSNDNTSSPFKSHVPNPFKNAVGYFPHISTSPMYTILACVICNQYGTDRTYSTTKTDTSTWCKIYAPVYKSAFTITMKLRDTPFN
jgi:hypothetical protein